MKVFRLLLLAVTAMLVQSVAARDWSVDVLGEPFLATVITQPDDYQGDVCSTVVKYSGIGADAAVLYVHGYNDYFFQREMADTIAAAGYGFYAVDLRKYGRSLLPGQTPFQVHDLHEYVADIDSALAVMYEDGVSRVALMGHSTGGLIVSVYMNGEPSAMVKSLILNSPFLDWNQSAVQEKFLIPVVRSFAPLMRSLKIPQGMDSGYSHSLLKRYGGEWEYDTDWKLEVSPPVEASWIAAIDAGHDLVQRHSSVKVPILLLRSDAGVVKGDGPDAYACRDAVLDVADISRYGRNLGVDVRETVIVGGLHDLALSAPAVRSLFYSAVLGFLYETIGN